MKAAQQALVDALLGRGEPPAGLSGGARGLQAYRNNLRALSAQALAVPFVHLRRALGEGDFASLAWTFWRTHPPERGDLAQWGGALEGFLIEHAGAASGLPGLARLDWALHQAERAADAVLDAASLQRLADVPPEQLTLRLRPGVALLTLEAQAFALLGEGGAGAGDVVVARQGWRGRWWPLAPGDAALMRALLAGESLSAALQAAGVAVKGLDAGADFDFGAWLAQALSEAWLQAAATPDPGPRS